MNKPKTFKDRRYSARNDPNWPTYYCLVFRGGCFAVIEKVQGEVYDENCFTSDIEALAYIATCVPYTPTL